MHPFHRPLAPLSLPLCYRAGSARAHAAEREDRALVAPQHAQRSVWSGVGFLQKKKITQGGLQRRREAPREYAQQRAVASELAAVYHSAASASDNCQARRRGGKRLASTQPPARRSQKSYGATRCSKWRSRFLLRLARCSTSRAWVCRPMPSSLGRATRVIRETCSMHLHLIMPDAPPPPRARHRRGIGSL